MLHNIEGQPAFSWLPHRWNLHIYWLVQCLWLCSISKRLAILFVCECVCFFPSTYWNLIFSFPTSGPSYSCDGTCWRGLGHIRALFGQAWPVSLCCFWWGHFLFPHQILTKQLQLSQCYIIHTTFKIINKWFMSDALCSDQEQTMWRSTFEKYCLSFSTSRHITKIYTVLNSVLLPFFFFNFCCWLICYCYITQQQSICIILNPDQYRIQPRNLGLENDASW